MCLSARQVGGITQVCLCVGEVGGIILLCLCVGEGMRDGGGAGLRARPMMPAPWLVGLNGKICHGGFGMLRARW